MEVCGGGLVVRGTLTSTDFQGRCTFGGLLVAQQAALAQHVAAEAMIEEGELLRHRDGRHWVLF